MEIATQTHLTALRDLLVYRQKELLAEVHAAGGEAADSGRAELALVEAALQRLDDGVYGDCLQCGRPIPLARLLVQPAVERCAACQASRDSALR